MTNESPFMTLAEVAVACSTPLASVRRWVNSGKIRGFKPGKRVLVLRTDLQAYLASSELTRGEGDAGQ